MTMTSAKRVDAVENVVIENIATFRALIELIEQFLGRLTTLAQEKINQT